MELKTQDIIEDGMAWKLEGSVGRSCMEAIENGTAVLGSSGHVDYWGNYVPSRHEVAPGTKGSIEYALARLDAYEENGEDVEDIRDRILRLRDEDRGGQA